MPLENAGRYFVASVVAPREFVRELAPICRVREPILGDTRRPGRHSSVGGPRGHRASEMTLPFCGEETGMASFLETATDQIRPRELSRAQHLEPKNFVGGSKIIFFHWEMVQNQIESGQKLIEQGFVAQQHFSQIDFLGLIKSTTVISVKPLLAVPVFV